jgi:hypothetical protein
MKIKRKGKGYTSIWDQISLARPNSSFIPHASRTSILACRAHSLMCGAHMSVSPLNPESVRVSLLFSLWRVGPLSQSLRLRRKRVRDNGLTDASWFSGWAPPKPSADFMGSIWWTSRSPCHPNKPITSPQIRLLSTIADSLWVICGRTR